MTDRARVAKPRTLLLVTGLLPLIVYICTLAPTITWRNAGADSGDLAAAVAVGGVPHPPGYPTYLVVGEVFKLLPVGDIAYRLNLLSASCAALAVAVVGLVIYHTLAPATQHQVQASEEVGKAQTYMWLCAASASLTLAFSGVFWSQAVIAEVYALNALFAALMLYGGLRVQPSNERWLVPGLAGLLGLSLGNHPSILLLLPMLVWILRKVRWRWQLVVSALLAFGAGLSVYVIIPIRAASYPSVNWGMATTFPNFLWLVSAELYRPFLFSLPWKSVLARIPTESNLVAAAFFWWGLLVGFLGLQRLIRLKRSLAYSSLMTFLIISAYAIGYNTTDSYVYLLPALLIFSLWIGWGLYDLANALLNLSSSRLGAGNLIVWGMVLLPLVSLALNFPQQDISQDTEAYDFAQQSLQRVAPGAVIIADDDAQTFALWYSRYGLAQRPDVAIVNTNLLPYAWYRQTLHKTHSNLRISDQSGLPVTTVQAFVDWNLPGSPIYLTTSQFSSSGTDRLEPLARIQPVVRLTGD
jgi:hypothetical protein